MGDESVSDAHRASRLAQRSPALLRVEQLSTVFDLPGGPAAAVSRVSFHVDAGETLGLVGESGSGKSVTAMSLLRLVEPPGRIAGGRIVFKGRDLLALPEDEMQQVRGPGIGLVFQDSMTALNPVFTIGNQIAETLSVHGLAHGRDARDRAIELLDAVSISNAATRVDDYPHQLSGGLRQRAMIALAICCNPALVIADEPTTALDVTVQAQILDLLRSLRDRLGLALLLITHDLGIVAEMADRVAVMYAGRIVEQGAVRDIFRDARHPYTRGLLASIPGGAAHGRLQAIPGAVPALGRFPDGCAFHPRCPNRVAPCDKAVPGMTLMGPIRDDIRHRSSEIGYRTDRRHEARCYLYSRAVDPEQLPEERP
jgi:oligopeptide/dipeptide ABC transporter ATP-binding protein